MANKSEKGSASFLIANAVEPGSKKPGTPELTSCGTLADRAVDAYKAMKDSEAAFALVESEVLAVTGPEYEARSRAGNHTKAFNLVGETTKGIQVVYADRFSPLAATQEAGLREQLGEQFDTCFEQKRKLTLKDDCTDDKSIALLRSKLGDELFLKVFEIKVTLEAKDDMDRKQFEIPEAVRTLCGLKQSKPGLKPVRKGS